MLLLAGSATALATGLGAVPVFLLGEGSKRLAPALWGFAAGTMGVASVVGLLLPAADDGSALEVAGGTAAGVAFMLAVRRYLDRHAWGNTSLADLLTALEEESGRDLDGWARSWLRESGTTTLRMHDGVLVQDGDRPHRVLVGRYDGLPLRRVEQVPVELPGPVEPIPPADLVLPTDGDLTFAKVRLDERSLATVRTSLPTLDDPLARALVWGSLWDSARDAELPPGDLVTAVLANVEGETDSEDRKSVV